MGSPFLLFATACRSWERRHRLVDEELLAIRSRPRRDRAEDSRVRGPVFGELLEKRPKREAAVFVESSSQVLRPSLSSLDVSTLIDPVFEGGSTISA